MPMLIGTTVHCICLRKRYLLFPPILLLLLFVIAALNRVLQNFVHLIMLVSIYFSLVAFFTFQTEVGVTLTPPTGKERAEGWTGLQGVRELKIKYEERDR